MKMLFCKACQDVVKLSLYSRTECACGKTQGTITKTGQAFYVGQYAVPIQFDNASFRMGVLMQPELGKGYYLTTFVAPRQSLTFSRLPDWTDKSIAQHERRRKRWQK